jgi:HK97 family phage major capsid protein
VSTITRDDRQARIDELERWLRDQHEEFSEDAFPDELREQWDANKLELDQHRQVMAELERRDDQLRAIGQRPANREEGATFGGGRQSGPQIISRMSEADVYDLSAIRTSPLDPEMGQKGLHDRALRAIELARFPHEGARKQDDRVRSHIEHLMVSTQQAMPGELARHILMTGSPIYRRAFGKTLAGAPLNAEEQRALTLSTAGIAVPFTLDATIIPTSNSSVNPARALARKETIMGSNTWQGVSSGAITASRVAEATEATDNAPTLAQPSATVTKAHAFIPFTIEAGGGGPAGGGDWGALETEMAKLLQDAKDDEEATAFVTGAGTGVNPQGFVTGTTATTAAASGLTVTAANIYALEAALPPRFRPNEQFVANRGIYNVVRGIDTAGGAALWLYISQGLVTQAPNPGNTGATLLGRGAWEASAMQATVVNATKIMVVGDFNYFLVVDRLGMTIELVPHIFGAANRFPTGQRGLYAYWRNTSKVLSASAFVALTGTT